jgi:phage tail sheath gpL-like
MITDASVAAGYAVQVVNKPLAFGSEVLPRKILIIATALSAYQNKHEKGVPFLVLSPEDVGSKCGFGGMAHRLALAAFRGSREAVPVYCLIENDNPAAAFATGEINLTVSAPEAGTFSLYVAGKRYAIPVRTTDTAALLGDRVAAALNADEDCPASAVNVDGVITLSTKSAGPWGNLITLTFNQRRSEGEALPDGVSPSFTPFSGGAGIPDLAADLPLALGSGDSANEDWFTDIIHGYGNDSAVLDALSEYNGVGNENAGLYSETVARPFRSLIGDTGAGSEGLQALINFTGNRKSDRTSGVVCRPGSLTHPAEIAAEAVGCMAFANADMAEKGFNEAILSGVDIGVEKRLSGGDWTTDYVNKDLAVHSGISPIVSKGGSAMLTNVVSFYRPDNIPEKNRCFRRMRDISIIQNIQNLYKQVFGSAKWTNFTVVNDVANVQNSASRAQARDAGMVRDELLNIVNLCMARAWIYDPTPSVAFLRTAQAVQVRDGGTGFNTRVPFVLSGEGNIMDNVVEVDASFAVMSQL